MYKFNGKDSEIGTERKMYSTKKMEPFTYGYEVSYRTPEGLKTCTFYFRLPKQHTAAVDACISRFGYPVTTIKQIKDKP